MLNRHEASEKHRLVTILDLMMKYNINLEYEVTRNTNEKLRNEHHLIIE